MKKKLFSSIKRKRKLNLDNENEENVKFPENQTVDKKRKIKLEEDEESVELPKNQTAGKEIKINLDKDEHNASIQAISEGYKCPTCGKSLASKYTLYRHRKDVHKENVMTETERQQKNKNCKTSLNKDEKNVEPLTRKYFFV